MPVVKISLYNRPLRTVSLSNGGNPDNLHKRLGFWIPAFPGMTDWGNNFQHTEMWHDEESGIIYRT